MPANYASENHIGEVGGKSVKLSGTITRPADTTAYAAGDEVSDSTSAPTVNVISGCSRIEGGSGIIVAASMTDSANQATVGQFELWLFDTTTTPNNDNAAYAPTDGVVNTVVAIIPLINNYVGNSGSGAAGNMVYYSDIINRVFQCAAGSTKLYWRLVIRNAYTPVSAEAFMIKLNILQD